MNAANARIGDWLGLRPPATEGEILRIVEERLLPSVVRRLNSLGLQLSEIDAVIIPFRTLQQRSSGREKLTVEETNSLLPLLNGFNELVRNASLKFGRTCAVRK